MADWIKTKLSTKCAFITPTRKRQFKRVPNQAHQVTSSVQSPEQPSLFCISVLYVKEGNCLKIYIFILSKDLHFYDMITQGTWASVLHTYNNQRNFLCLKWLQKWKWSRTFPELQLNHMMGVFCVQKIKLIGTHHSSVTSYEKTLIKVSGSFFIPQSLTQWKQWLEVPPLQKPSRAEVTLLSHVISLGRIRSPQHSCNGNNHP